MKFNVHKLSQSQHSNFLSENRIDPISLDTIEKNDEVVICASCKSVFLLSSWKYIGASHCNQQKTLTQLPKTQKIVISTKKTIEKFEIPLQTSTQEIEENTLSFDVFAFVGSAFGCIYFVYLFDYVVDFGMFTSLIFFAVLLYIILIRLKFRLLNFFSFIKEKIMTLFG